MTFLDASSNKIEEIASEISDCTKLNDLTLSSNEIRELPNDFCKLYSLTILRLDANFLSKLPDRLGEYVTFLSFFFLWTLNSLNKKQRNRLSLFAK